MWSAADTFEFHGEVGLSKCLQDRVLWMLGGSKCCTRAAAAARPAPLGHGSLSHPCFSCHTQLFSYEWAWSERASRCGIRRRSTAEVASILANTRLLLLGDSHVRYLNNWIAASLGGTFPFARLGYGRHALCLRGKSCCMTRTHLRWAAPHLVAPPLCLAGKQLPKWNGPDSPPMRLNQTIDKYNITFTYLGRNYAVELNMTLMNWCVNQADVMREMPQVPLCPAALQVGCTRQKQQLGPLRVPTQQLRVFCRDQPWPDVLLLDSAQWHLFMLKNLTAYTEAMSELLGTIKAVVGPASNELPGRATEQQSLRRQSAAR